MSFGMQIKTVENPQADILTSNNNLSQEDRKLTQTQNLPACTNQNCPPQSGSLTDENASYDYSVVMSANSRSTFSFTVGSDQTTLGLILSATPSVSMQTNIKLNPSGSYPGDTVQGSSWAGELTIDSASSSRTLTIYIQTNTQPTTARFQILVENIDSSSSKTWMPPVFAIIGAGLMIFCVLGICCRIRRRRLFRRRMRAQAAYEVAMRQYDDEYNQPIHPRPQSQQNQRNQRNQSAQRAQAPAQNNQQNHPLAPPVEILNADPNGTSLSKENFEQRFPERANKMFKSSFPQTTCSICLENLGKNEKCRQLYCEHIFHSECVKLWLLNQVEKQKNCFCPNCNKKMTYVIEIPKQSS